MTEPELLWAASGVPIGPLRHQNEVHCELQAPVMARILELTALQALAGVQP